MNRKIQYQSIILCPFTTVKILTESAEQQNVLRRVFGHFISVTVLFSHHGQKKKLFFVEN